MRPSPSAKCSTSVRSRRDRKSTRLNSSHGYISYAVFCLKKKNPYNTTVADLALRTPPLKHIRLRPQTVHARSVPRHQLLVIYTKSLETTPTPTQLSDRTS